MANTKEQIFELNKILQANCDLVENFLHSLTKEELKTIKTYNNFLLKKIESEVSR